MNHRWIEKKEGRKTYQVCLRCGVQRVRETNKALIAITGIPPYYHYRYESVWAYIIGEKKTLFRPDCPGVAPKDCKLNETLKMLEVNHG